MADRIFKGRLSTITTHAFPESAERFSEPHKGGLVPFEVLKKILTADKAGGGIINGSLFITAGDTWVKIDPDGTIEIGSSGA